MTTEELKQYAIQIDYSAENYRKVGERLIELGFSVPYLRGTNNDLWRYLYYDNDKFQGCGYDSAEGKLFVSLEVFLKMEFSDKPREPKDWCVKWEKSNEFADFINLANKVLLAEWTGRSFDSYYGVLNNQPQCSSLSWGTTIVLPSAISILQKMLNQQQSKSETKMEPSTVIIPEHLLKELSVKGTSEQKSFVKSNVDFFTHESTVIGVKAFYEKFSPNCSTIKSLMEKEFPFLVEKKIPTPEEMLKNENIYPRTGGIFVGKAFWLSDRFDWQIVRDSNSGLCLTYKPK